MNMGLDWPNMRLTIILADLSLHIVYVLSLDLRLSHVLEMWIDLLWGYQTLHRNRVVTKVVFGFVMKHAARHGQSRWDLPLSVWERYLWAPRVIGSRNAWPCYIRLRVNLVRDSESHDREREVSLELDHISWGKGKGMYWTLWWFVRMIFIRV
jgi:hypothetical protein